MQLMFSSYQQPLPCMSSHNPEILFSLSTQLALLGHIMRFKSVYSNVHGYLISLIKQQLYPFIHTREFYIAIFFSFVLKCCNSLLTLSSTHNLWYYLQIGYLSQLFSLCADLLSVYLHRCPLHQQTHLVFESQEIGNGLPNLYFYV